MIFHSRIDFAKVIPSHAYIAQNIRDFFYVSLMKFSPCAKFLRQFSQQQDAKIGLYLIGIKACHAFLHMSSKSCPKLYSITTVDPGYNSHMTGKIGSVYKWSLL